MTFWIRNWLIAFGITLGLELLVAVPLLSVEPRMLRRIAVLILVNLATHPIVWFVFPALAAQPAMRFAAAELFAFLVEAWAFSVIWIELPARKALSIALLANTVSATTGLLLHALLAF